MKSLLKMKMNIKHHSPEELFKSSTTTIVMPKKSPVIETFEINIPIFGMYIELFIGDDFAKIPEWLEGEFEQKFTLDESDCIADGLTIDLSQQGLDGYIVIALKDFWKKISEDFTAAMGVLTHEAFHAAKMVMDSRGIPFIEDNEELVAYLTEFITESILDTVTHDDEDESTDDTKKEEASDGSK